MFASRWIPRRIAKRQERRASDSPFRTAMLAAQLYPAWCGSGAGMIENVFVLAAARWLMRPTDALPLGT